MRQKPQVITDAAISLDEARRIRTKRYLIAMTLRGVVVVLCAILATMKAPLLWLWLLLGVLIVAVMPWLTVLLANDRLVTRKMKRMKREREEQALRGGSDDDKGEQKSIDSE